LAPNDMLSTRLEEEIRRLWADAIMLLPVRSMQGKLLRNIHHCCCIFRRLDTLGNLCEMDYPCNRLHRWQADDSDSHVIVQSYFLPMLTPVQVAYCEETQIMNLQLRQGRCMSIYLLPRRLSMTCLRDIACTTNVLLWIVCSCRAFDCSKSLMHQELVGAGSALTLYANGTQPLLHDLCSLPGCDIVILIPVLCRSM